MTIKLSGLFDNFFFIKFTIQRKIISLAKIEHSEIFQKKKDKKKLKMTTEKKTESFLRSASYFNSRMPKYVF